MFRKISDFVETWNHERNSTLKIFRNIPEDLKTNKIHPDVRSLERLAWHITNSNTSMITMAGIKLDLELKDEETPASMEQLIRIYEESTALIQKEVALQWKDAEMEEMVNMYGEQWSKGRTLFIILGHQSHHRSQMTIICRSLNIPIAGTWGPCKEEWLAYGMPAMV